MTGTTSILALGALCLAAFVGVVWTASRSAARRAAVMREVAPPASPVPVASDRAEDSAPGDGAMELAEPAGQPEEAPVLHPPEPDPLPPISDLGSLYALAEHLLVIADQLLELGDEEGGAVQAAGYRLEALADALDLEDHGDDEQQMYELTEMLEHAEGQVRAAYLHPPEVMEFLEESLLELSIELPTHELALVAVRAFEALRRREERRWTEPTVNDRITRAFAALNRRGIVAREFCGGSTMDGWAALPRGTGHGACFFHEQDVDRGVRGQGLMLTFGPLRADQAEDDDLGLRIGREIVEVLEAHEVPVSWSGDLAQKIEIRPFPWRRRRAP